MNTILSFIVTSFIIELMPGPNMAYLAILGATQGRRAGFYAVAGIALGLLSIGILAAFGVATLISNSPLAYDVLRWCGVFFLLWLAWDGWNTGNETSPGKVNRADVRFFWRGLIVNILNPKAAMFYVIMLPRFVDASAALFSQTFTLTMIYVCIATSIHSLIVAMAGTAQTFFSSTRAITLIRRLLSLTLIMVALWFAMTTGRTS